MQDLIVVPFTPATQMRLEELGFSIREYLCDLANLQGLTALVGDAAAGHRNLLDIPQIATAAAGPILTNLVAPILGPNAFAVRGILFDRTYGRTAVRP